MKKAVYYIAVACCLSAAPWASAQQHNGASQRNSPAERMFTEMDANGDGVVSREEYNAFYNKRFDEVDLNHDGKISHKEMEASREKALKQFGERVQEQFNQRFDAADANHDGALSREEAQKMPQVARYFDEIDVNQDGRVTRDEIKAYVEKLRRERKPQP